MTDGRARTLRLEGSRVRQLRIERGLTREQLAARGKGPDSLSIATIKRAERGECIYASSAGALARLLAVPLASLVASDAREPSAAGGATIAVLPFAHDGLDAEVQWFAHGLVDDLLHRLGALWFPVIARGSSFALHDHSNVNEAAAALQADFLIDGSVRRYGSRARITYRLLEASGLQVRSSSRDGDCLDVLALQDELAREIASFVGGDVLDRKAATLKRRPISDLTAWELSLRSLWHFHRNTPDDNRSAAELAQAALERDRSLSVARYVLLVSAQYALLNQWTPDVSGTLAHMCAQAHDFERVAPGDPWMYLGTAYASLAAGERGDAIARLEQALEIAPNNFAAHLLYGQTLAMAGQPDAALHELDLAHRLSPRDPRLWTVALAKALSHFVAERYEEAVHWASRAAHERPHLAYCWAVLAASHAKLDDRASARRALTRAMQRHPTLDLAGFMPSYAATDREISERFGEALSLAGLTAHQR